MRKMMLVAAALLTVAVTQAASVGWSLAGANNYANDAYRFFIIGQNGVTDIATITDLLDAGKVDEADAKAFGSGTVNSSGAANVAYTSSGKSISGAGTYEAFFVIFDATTSGAANNYALVSGASGLTKTIGASTASVSFSAANQSSFLNNTDNWHPTPEPCSVALLLLGAAAFGLKRKRA